MKDDSEFRQVFSGLLIKRLTSNTIRSSSFTRTPDENQLASLVDDHEILPGQPIVLVGTRSLKLLEAIAMCIQRAIPFLLLDRRIPLEEVKGIASRLNLRSVYDVDEQVLLLNRTHDSVTMLPDAMYLVRSSRIASFNFQTLTTLLPHLRSYRPFLLLVHFILLIVVPYVVLYI